MKRLNLPKWKKKKRFSFFYYFMAFVSLIICASVTIALGFSELANAWLVEGLHIPEIVIVLVFSLIIGSIISLFVGRFIITPIKRIRNAMNEVAEGDLEVSVQEESRIDEVEDINHAFNIMVKELRSTEMIQSDFISNVSHEFKTPLTAIEGYTTMLQEGDLTEEERREYTNKILYNTHRMSELVNNILLLSKLDNQGIESQKESFSLDEQIRQEILSTEARWSEKGLDLDVQLDSIVYQGNRGLLSHVWSNLLGNAVKFSPVGGKILLELKKMDGYIYFAVSDEGEGIKEEAKKYIFNKFYQSDTSHKQEGNGLGLALVKKILDLCDGEVEAENLEPKGCRFIVRLPY